jgi:hypothetical protein
VLHKYYYGFVITYPKSAIKVEARKEFLRFFGESEKKQYEVLIGTMARSNGT